MFLRDTLPHNPQPGFDLPQQLWPPAELFPNCTGALWRLSKEMTSNRLGPVLLWQSLMAVRPDFSGDAVQWLTNLRRWTHIQMKNTWQGDHPIFCWWKRRVCSVVLGLRLWKFSFCFICIALQANCFI